MKSAINLHKIGPGGIVLHINVKDADTPAMVYDSLRKRCSSTYACALDQGCIDDTVELNDAQIAWLSGFAERVDAAFEVARKDDRRYG